MHTEMTNILTIIKTSNEYNFLGERGDDIFIEWKNIYNKHIFFVYNRHVSKDVQKDKTLPWMERRHVNI